MRVAPEIFWEEGAYRSTNPEQVLRTSPPSRIKFEQAKRALTMPHFLSIYSKDVDFDEYRKKNDMRAVKKNCTLPSWLNYEAEKANINFSQLLQQALIQKLNLTNRKSN